MIEGEIGAAAIATGGAFAWAVRGRASSIFGRSVWRGPRDRRAIALTFDDGPSEATPRILEALARFRVRATFFQCGANVERLPCIARAVSDAGHEIGNHTHTHPLLCFRSPNYMLKELELAQRAIENHARVTPVWFRAPFGARWPGIGAAQERFGLTGVMWTVIGYDWKLTADAVADRISGEASNGAILCLHDGRELRVKPDIGATVDAVMRLVPELIGQGYRFETVSQLLCQTT